MGSGATCEKTNVFPGKSWVHRHVVDLGAEVSCPSCFGNEYFVLDGFVEVGESIMHRIGNGGRKSGREAEGVDQLVAFVDGGGNVVSIEDEPVIPLRLDKEGCVVSRFLDFVMEVFVRHVIVVRGR